KAVPLRSNTEGQSLARAIAGAHPEFIQASVVVTAEALEDLHGQSAILGSAVGELVPRPVVDSDGTVDILVDVEWGGEPLGEDVNNVVVGIGSVVKISPESSLPFLSLNDMLSV